MDPRERSSLRVAWTLALECISLTPLVLSGVRPSVLVISAIAAFTTANLVCVFSFGETSGGERTALQVTFRPKLAGARARCDD